MPRKKPAELRRFEKQYSRLVRQTAHKAKRDAAHRRLPRILLVTAAVLIAAGALTAYFLLRGQSEKPAAVLTVEVLDVGQGDAILIRTQSDAFLIDAGDTDHAEAVAAMLHARGVRTLTGVLNTHPHADHLGGMQSVLEECAVKTLYLAETPPELVPTTAAFSALLAAAEKKKIPIVMPECSETLSLGDASLTFLSVACSGAASLNDCSLCCLLTCGGITMLFTGDMGAAEESAMLAAGLLPKADVLKIAHHGGSASTGAALLETVSPRYAVISCGAENDYGHPSSAVLRRLSEAGCTVCRTDLDGTVRITTDGSALQITGTPNE